MFRSFMIKGMKSFFGYIFVSFRATVSHGQVTQFHDINYVVVPHSNCLLKLNLFLAALFLSSSATTEPLMFVNTSLFEDLLLIMV